MARRSKSRKNKHHEQEGRVVQEAQGAATLPPQANMPGSQQGPEQMPPELSDIFTPDRSGVSSIRQRGR